MRSGGIKKQKIKNQKRSKSKDYLFGIWSYILLYATQYLGNVKTKRLELVIDSFLMTCQ